MVSMWNEQHGFDFAEIEEAVVDKLFHRTWQLCERACLQHRNPSGVSCCESLLLLFFCFRCFLAAPRLRQPGGATVAQPYNGPVAQQAVVGQAGNQGGAHVVIVRQGQNGGPGIHVTK